MLILNTKRTFTDNRFGRNKTITRYRLSRCLLGRRLEISREFSEPEMEQGRGMVARKLLDARRELALAVLELRRVALGNRP